MMAFAMRCFVAVTLVLGVLVTWALVRFAGMALPWAIAVTVLIAVAMHALIVGAGFVLAWILSYRPGAHAPASGWLWAWPRETAISIRNMYVDIPFRNRWRRQAPPASKGVVLLVHGYGCNRGVWRGFDTWLARLGWTVDAVDLEPAYASIDEFGRQVALAARKLAAETGVNAVIVIAHSMGGLSTRAGLRADPAAPIAHVITACTPHQGTFHARLGRGVCSREMIPGCVWLTDLNGAEPALSPERFTCIASRHDNIVSPLAVALMPGAASFVRDGVGHMQVLHDPAVRRYIAARLDALQPGVGSAPR